MCQDLQVADSTQFDWEQCDSSEAGETVVFLGSGASADVGLPTALELHERLLEKLSPLYANLAELVFNRNPVDVERLFRVIEFVYTIETTNRVQDRRVAYDGPDIAQLVDRWKASLQQYFDMQARTVQGTASGQLIDGLWDALFDLLWLLPNDQPDLRYLRWLLKSMRGGTIVTLNYDNCLDKAAYLRAAQPIDADPYPRDWSIALPGPDRSESVRIIKLHGSLGWTTSHTGESPVIPDNEYLPAAHRESNDFPLGPHVPASSLVRETSCVLTGHTWISTSSSREVLNNARRLIVIGYGWNDVHVNEVLRKWLQRLVTPRVFRLGQLGGASLPREPAMWLQGNDSVIVEVIPGPAAETIVEITNPTPGLLR